MTKKEIIPAILPMTFAELVEQIELVKGMVKTVQVDICDGQFVPNATWPYRKHDDSFEKIIKEAEGLPAWEDLNYEFDLMVNHPETIVDDWVIAGASRLVIHAEAKGDLTEVFDKLGDRVEVGLALDMQTDLSVVDKWYERINFVQLMGIDNEGFQHQPFDAQAIDRLKKLREKYPELIIAIDGGVSLETAPSLIEAGANRLIIGSAIFQAENVFEAIHHFKML